MPQNRSRRAERAQSRQGAPARAGWFHNTGQDTFCEEARDMGGPIVRTGTTPAFWENWDRAFEGKKASSAKAKPAAKKKAAKPVKAKATKKAKKK